MSELLLSKYLIEFGILIIAVFISIYWFFDMRNKRKDEIEKIAEYCIEVRAKLESEGVDKQYRSLDNDTLLALYQKLTQECECREYPEDYALIVELGQKAEIIREIMKDRNIAIPRKE